MASIISPKKLAPPFYVKIETNEQLDDLLRGLQAHGKWYSLTVGALLANTDQEKSPPSYQMCQGEMKVDRLLVDDASNKEQFLGFELAAFLEGIVFYLHEQGFTDNDIKQMNGLVDA